MTTKTHKIADVSNGWESEAMTLADAERAWVADMAPTPRIVAPVDAEWRFDHRDQQWAWFVGDKRIY